MTPSKIKSMHEEANPSSQFFKPDTLKFFGDSMENFRAVKVRIVAMTGKQQKLLEWHDVTEAWELRRIRPVRYGLQASVFFNSDCSQTFAVPMGAEVIEVI